MTRARTSPAVASAAPAEFAHFVGAKDCTVCHSAEGEAWQNSHHAKAMQHATPGTVLGDFNDAHFTYGPVTSTAPAPMCGNAQKRRDFSRNVPKMGLVLP
jgi:hypothetical protein